VCVCVCDGDPRLRSRDENMQTRGGAQATAQAITIQSGFRHCLLLKRDRNECVQVRRTDNDERLVGSSGRCCCVGSRNTKIKGKSGPNDCLRFCKAGSGLLLMFRLQSQGMLQD